MRKSSFKKFFMKSFNNFINIYELNKLYRSTKGNILQKYNKERKKS